jgi:hypothetical protein
MTRRTVILANFKRALFISVTGITQGNLGYNIKKFPLKKLNPSVLR